MIRLVIVLAFVIPGGLCCRDLMSGCPRWAAAGRCNSMPDSMLLHCKLSCNNCDDGLCFDQLDECEQWAMGDLCRTNASYMLRYCKHSCEVCDEQLLERSNRRRKIESTTPSTMSKPRAIVTVTTSKAISPQQKEEVNLDVCVDLDVHRCPYWQEAGYCETNDLVRTHYCTKTCGTCGPAKEVTKKCEDHDIACKEWASYGQCEENPGYMLEACPRSCGKCGGEKKPKPRCEDIDDGCTLWATYGHCDSNPEFMFSNCKKTCKFCDLKERPKKKNEVIENPETSTAVCTDKNKWCFVWSLEGACERNPFYMLISCKLSCGACGDKDVERQEPQKKEVVKESSSCKDGLHHCPLWAASGLCFTNTKVMQSVCPLSCGICSTSTPTITASKCIDAHELCSQWASDRQCEENPSYMNEHCPKSCGLCSTEIQSRVEKPGLIHQIPAGECKDEEKNCVAWSKAEVSECTRNSGWMLGNCRKSCGNCKNERIGGDSNCRDNFGICVTYAADGNCELLPTAMKISCRYSCGYCGVCRDIDTKMCNKWKLLNMCSDNELWMRNACKKTCGFC